MHHKISPPSRLLLHTTYPLQNVDKHYTVNVKNDQKCSVWSVLASLYPASDYVNEPYIYFPYKHTLNTGNLSFPLAVKDMPNLLTCIGTAPAAN